MAVPILLFILGFLLLIKGGDWFVDGASGLARRFHLPEILIGATIVSIGTTLPEIMVSATSAFEGHGQIAYGNAIGSIICNTTLIAAVTIAIKPGKTDRRSLIVPLSFFFVAEIFYMVIAYTQKTFKRWAGISFLLIFVAYTVVSILTVRKTSEGSETEIPEPDEEITEENEKSKKRIKFKNENGFFAKVYYFVKRDSLFMELILLVIGAAFIAVGARLLVDNGTIIAEKMGVPETVIALTFVALGTSLPELVTAISSLIKGHSNLSLGNIIGANLFNIVLVCGVAITVNPFDIPQTTMLFNMPSSLVLDLPLSLAVMVILAVPALIKGKLYRAQGIALLAIYAGFCALQFIM